MIKKKLPQAAKAVSSLPLECNEHWRGSGMLLHVELEKGLCFCHVVIRLLFSSYMSRD